MEPLIFEKSRSGRRAFAQSPGVSGDLDIPESFLRKDKPLLPEASELQVVRHFTRLSQLNFSIDTQFYPLGSCTMKYNPRACNALALLPGFAGRHPLGPVGHGQGFLTCMYELQEMLKALTGMQGVSLTPMAGAQGELAGVAMIRAYHKARGDLERNEIIVPDAAHGTNPATATMCGCVVRELPTGSDGDINIDALKAVVGQQTAGIMLTNPSTLGIFERLIVEVARIVHEAGGLLYYDGANLNANCGKVRPGDMGFDVIHMNLHKTFSTPHGGGGPGSGPVALSAALAPYAPLPAVIADGDGFRLVEHAGEAAQRKVVAPDPVQWSARFPHRDQGVLQLDDLLPGPGVDPLVGVYELVSAPYCGTIQEGVGLCERLWHFTLLFARRRSPSRRPVWKQETSCGVDRHHRGMASATGLDQQQSSPTVKRRSPLMVGALSLARSKDPRT